MWRSIEETPAQLRSQILRIYGRKPDTSPEDAFKGWFMVEEQRAIMEKSGRRQFYVNCWHAAQHESVAMWKIYGSPGAGVAILTNGGRLETALASNTQELHLGAVRYIDPATFVIGTPTVFEAAMAKRASYSYEQEVRLVHWDTSDQHDALANFSWNAETMRFDDLIEDTRPVIPGITLECDLSVLIERVIVSPFAPPWYLPMIERLKERLALDFPVSTSKLLVPPQIVV